MSIGTGFTDTLKSLYVINHYAVKIQENSKKQQAITYVLYTQEKTFLVHENIGESCDDRVSAVCKCNEINRLKPKIV
jgi:hypothetical protein